MRRNGDRGDSLNCLLLVDETQLALGLPPSTLHRLERGDQSITLRGLQQIMKRLKCGLQDIFGD
jgi:DNA-binding Xre family transcriptional regulator